MAGAAELGTAIGRVLSGTAQGLELGAGGLVRLLDGPVSARLVLPGSFNPLHCGHTRMMEAARTALQVPRADCVFELTVHNADKGQIEAAEVERRLAPFVLEGLRVALSRCPLFCDKAAVFPNASFVVGVDTAERIVDPKYYGGTEQGLLQALELFRECGCGFVVGGRVGTDGRFRGLDALQIPAPARSMFVGLTEEQFRLDISSTEIRRGEKSTGL